MGAGVADSRLVAKVEGGVGERVAGKAVRRWDGAGVLGVGGLTCRRLEVSGAWGVGWC